MFLAVKEAILWTRSSFFPSYIFRRPSRMSFQEVKSHVLLTIAAGFLVEGRSLCNTLHRQDLPHPKASLSLFNYLLPYFYLLEKHLEDLLCVFYILTVSSGIHVSIHLSSKLFYMKKLGLHSRM